MKRTIFLLVFISLSIISFAQVSKTVFICNKNAKEYSLKKLNGDTARIMSKKYNLCGVKGFIEVIKDEYNFYPDSLSVCEYSCGNPIIIPEGTSEKKGEKIIQKEEKKAPPPTITPELTYKIQKIRKESGGILDAVAVSNFKEFFSLKKGESSGSLKISHPPLDSLNYIEIGKKRFIILYINYKKDSLVANGSKLPVLLVPEKDKSGKTTHFLLDNSNKTMSFYNKEGFYEFVLDTENSDLSLIKSDTLFQMIFDEKYLKDLGDMGEIISVDEEYFERLKRLINK